MPYIYPKTAPSLRRSPPPSNTPVPQPTPLITPNDIWICSAVLPQYTLRTDRQTDGPIDRPTDGLGDRSVPTGWFLATVTNCTPCQLLDIVRFCLSLCQVCFYSLYYSSSHAFVVTGYLHNKYLSLAYALYIDYSDAANNNKRGNETKNKKPENQKNLNNASVHIQTH